MSQTRQDWERRARELRIETRAFIDGHYRAAVEGDTFDCQSPIDGRSLGQVAGRGMVRGPVGPFLGQLDPGDLGQTEAESGTSGSDVVHTNDHLPD